ncbi:PREDICTED: uncharacterized protein LOC105110633 isoform X3 [Populus euphratica]|uniref:Uncharacterized protein LOC105110633 isoform X3 n=1 Tax=Populus euphratica TaxID=75702 RepID=A0AAJ6X3H8_POPEU|nr:PREDICTED: uncharacterized protein LOC105110633 isoform X3 [Populus euphratica]XP_011004060.1 PREDICTED: uncharacterized protein LOC105110633 isoform X3 [Populus euphratica]
MTTRVTQTPLIIQDENLGVSRKKVGFDGTVKKSKTATKKSGGFALGNRKALDDITNKAVVRQETSSRKKNVQKEEINNVAEERFLHDHSKCIEEKEATLISSFLDLVLPGHDSVSSSDENPEVKQVKVVLILILLAASIRNRKNWRYLCFLICLSLQLSGTLLHALLFTGTLHHALRFHGNLKLLNMS